MHVILLVIAFLVVHTNSKAVSHVRRAVEDDDKIDCRYVRGDIRYEDGTTEPFDACEDGNTLYDLSPEFLDGIDRLHDLHSGKTRLEIQGAREIGTPDITETDRIESTAGTETKVILHAGTSTRGLSSVTNNEVITTTGPKTLLIVRVTSLDSNVSLSSEELSESAFGHGVSLATQMHRCSNGKIEFYPAVGAGINGGVGELKLESNTIGVQSKNLQTALREAFVENFGEEDQYDFIAYCLPAKTGDPERSWIAYAFRDTKFSCESLMLISRAKVFA